MGVGVITATVLLVLLAILAVIGEASARKGAPLHPAAHPPATTHGGGRYRVGILGDSQKGLANLRNITQRVMAEEVLFLLHTGDLVSDNDIGHYRLAAEYLKKGGARSIPYVAPGNHDLKGGPELFTVWCGALERSFSVGDVAFVVLNNAFGNPPPEPRTVDERIAAAGPHKTVVLAMHQPPFDAQGNPKPGYEGFLAWLEKSTVSYLLCGHLHTYMRKQVGGTTVVINGVGGDYDSGQLDQKVYATILEIDGTKITDRAIETEPVHEVWENIEHFAVGHLMETQRRYPLFGWGVVVLLGLPVGTGWPWLLRRRKIPTAA